MPGTDTERPNWRRRLSVTVEDIAVVAARRSDHRGSEDGAAGMSARVTIEKIEPLSHRWAKLDRYTIAYTRRDGSDRDAGARSA